MNSIKDNRYVVDVPGASIQDEDNSPEITAGTVHKRDSIMHETMNGEEHEDDNDYKPETR